MSHITLNRSKFEAQKAALNRSLEKAIEEKRKVVAEKARFAAIKVARDLAERTFPSADAIGLAVAAMRFDVGRVYITPGRAFEILRSSAGEAVAGAFYAAHKRGQLSQAESIIRRSNSPIRNIEVGSLRPDLHQRSRNANGRVELKAPLQVVEKREIDAYVKSEISKIGKTASGWNAAAAALGGSEGPTRWKSTAVHGSEGGSAEEIHVEGKAGFLIRNLRPLARKHISPGQVARILKDGAEYFRRLLAE